MNYYCAVFQTDLIELRRPNFSIPRIQHLFQWSNPFRTLNYHGRRQPALIIIWTLLFIGYFPTMQTEQVNGQGDFWPSERSNDSDCATCQRERALSVLKDDEIKRWRIETTKKQILDKLEMQDRPPRVKTKDGHFHGLPPIAFQLPDDTQNEPEVEPARQLILLPEKIFRRGKDSHVGKTSTLKFHITNEMNESALHSAVLWTPEKLSSFSTKSSATAVNWHASDVTRTVDHQIEQQFRSLSLTLNATSVYNVGQVNQPRPYLIVQLDPSIKRSSADSLDRVSARRKRQTTPMCSSTVTQCCRESLYISFKDVGWDDWIAGPNGPGFNAYYCRGSCRTISGPGTGATQHASILQNLLARDRVPTASRPHLAPCCAPTRLSPLTVFYSDENNVIKQRTLQNMIVESCGCAL